MSPVRRVRRVVRKIDPWTVLKVSFVLNVVGALAFVLGSVIFWSVFVNAGIPDKISELAELLTLTFTADGPTYFRVVVLLAVIGTILVTGFFTLAAIMYNLIADIVGGIEIVVLEESVVPLARPQRTTPAPPSRPRGAESQRTPTAAVVEPVAPPAPQRPRAEAPERPPEAQPVAGGQTKS